MSREMGQMSDKNQNTMIVKTLKYKFSESDPSWSSIPIQQNSGTFVENSQDTEAGKLFITEIAVYIPHITSANDAIVNKLNERLAIYQVTDTKDNTYIIGNDTEKGRALSSKKIGPAPGIAHGYDLKITCSSIKEVITTYPAVSGGSGSGEPQGEDDTTPMD